MRFILSLVMCLMMATPSFAVGLGEYTTPEGSTGKMKLYVQEDGTTAIDITISSTEDGSGCEFKGLCLIDGNKIKCENLEEDPDGSASLMGILTDNSIEFTSGDTRNVCDPRGCLLGVYKFASAASADASTGEMIPPMGILTLKDDFTSATMKLRYDSDGNMLMVIKSISTDNVKCAFEGMCNFSNNSSIECRQAVGDKVVYVTGTFDLNTINILPSSTDAICPKGGVIDGTYVKK